MIPLNLPNALTLLRILAVPVVVVALLSQIDDGDVIAAIVFGFAAASDGLDGYIARRRNQVTNFGKLMDPLADKLLVVAALISLVDLNRLAGWIAMVIIARELAVTGLRTLAAEQGVIVAASWLGKVKTTLQIGAIFALIAYDPAPLWVDLLVYAAVAMTLISGVDYFLGLRRTMADSAGQREPPASAQREPEEPAGREAEAAAGREAEAPAQREPNAPERRGPEPPAEGEPGAPAQRGPDAPGPREPEAPAISPGPR